MPTENEIRVMEILSAIELPPGLGQIIEAWGNEAVTVVCEAALGTYPGLRPKVRTNAVSLLGRMSHPQAVETVPMLVNDTNEDVAIRAMRAAGRQKNEAVVEKLGQVLQNGASPPVLAAEAVKALMAIDTPTARQELEQYKAKGAAALPHRGSAVVRGILDREPGGSQVPRLR